MHNRHSGTGVKFDSLSARTSEHQTDAIGASLRHRLELACSLKKITARNLPEAHGDLSRHAFANDGEAATGGNNCS
jgi:hypothetical protein